MSAPTKTPDEWEKELDDTWEFLFDVHCRDRIAMMFSPHMKQMEEIALGYKAEWPEEFERWIHPKEYAFEDDDEECGDDEGWTP